MFKLYYGENVNLQWDDDEVHVVYRVRRNFPKVTTLLTQQGHVIQLIENFTYFKKMQIKSVVHKKSNISHFN